MIRGAVILPLRCILPVVLLLATPWTAAERGGETEPASGSPTLVILVRHAEKSAGGPDPRLSPPGRERASELARALADVPVDALYASQYLRTRETLEPLAAALDRPIETAPIEGDVAAWARGFAERLLREHPGGTVVVAGHSNTVPVLLRALGAHDAPDLSEKDYDDLFWVWSDGVSARWVHLHFGARSD